MLHRFLASILLIAAPATAQVAYDAGTAGNPPQAPSPTSQGWTELITGSCSVQDVSPDPDFPINAWEIRDSGTGKVEYFDDFGSNQPYEAEIVLRPLAGTVYLDLIAGNLLTDNRFEIELVLAGNDIHVFGNGALVGVATNAVGAYHSFRFLSGYAWDYGYVFYDDVYLGKMDYQIPDPLDDAGLLWGTLGAGESGRARVHSAHFDLLRDHPLGVSYCGPAVSHSGGKPGRMAANGKPFAFTNDVELVAFDLPPQQFGYFLVSATQDFIANPGGSQGNLCLGGNIGRYSSNVMSSGPQGTFSLAIDLTNLPTSPPSKVLSGETWSFQAWFRDKNPTPTSNFTDGRAILFL